MTVTKPDLGNGVSHPARFSKPLIDAFAEILEANPRPIKSVLDPFAGTGKIHDLAEKGYSTLGVEIEPEWAMMHPQTVIGDAVHLPFSNASFDAVVTSPCYGNRYADHHNAADGSSRRSYKHDLGRDLDPGNAGQMHWGDEYRSLHQRAWLEAHRVLVPGGLLVLNIKDHYRTVKRGEPSQRQYVSGWHVSTLSRIDCTLLYHREVPARGMRAGENADLRIAAEQIYVFSKNQHTTGNEE
jgi:SAM-dependent methyltransferase